MTEWKRRCLAIVLTFFATGAVYGQSSTPAAPPPPANSKPAVTAGLETFTSGWLRKTLTEARPGSCQAPKPVTPVSSWPARSEAAITFCRR